MSRFRGEEELIARTADFKRAVIRINEQVYFITGYGGSNAVLIIGEESCILVDALNGCQVAQEALRDIRQITDRRGCSDDFHLRIRRHDLAQAAGVIRFCMI